jgi:PKD repeat protein
VKRKKFVFEISLISHNKTVFVMKRIFLVQLVILLSTCAIVAQSSPSRSFSFIVKDCNKAQTTNNGNPTELEAGFRVDKTFGPAPLTVHFEDRSSGNPVSWLWIFGDGTSDTVQNPQHTYNEEGIFTVKLSVKDADSTVSVETRENYIRAVGYGACDTLNYEIPGSHFLYSLPLPQTGFLSGNNSRGDLSKASFFPVEEDKGMLMGGIYYFAYKTSAFATDPQIVFKAWDSDGVTSSPGKVLDSTGVVLSQIPVSQQELQPPTLVFFDEWVTISESFYLGFDLPQTQGDTLAVFTNKIEAATFGNGWEQTAQGEWQRYEQGLPGYNVDNAIYPLICQPTGIDNHILEQNLLIYPVPATDYLYISVLEQGIKNVELSLYDIAGRLILKKEMRGDSLESLDVSELKQGLYILKINSSKGVFNKKVMVK